MDCLRSLGLCIKYFLNSFLEGDLVFKSDQPTLKSNIVLLENNLNKQIPIRFPATVIDI